MKQVTFVDEAGRDFHLAADDDVARDRGLDLAGDSVLSFSDDVDGESRPSGGAWDIGADER